MTPQDFWSRVDRSAGCHVWMGARSARGYGTVRADSRMQRAHRIAFILAHGAVPEGLFVLHHCDNPPCVKTEPDEQWPDGHLFLGTHRDNMADMWAKGRAGVLVHPERLERGEGRYNHRLNDDVVRTIRTSAESGPTLAERYSVSRQTIWTVRRGSTWQHVEAIA